MTTKSHIWYQMALAKSRIEDFTRFTLPSYRMGWVHKEICQELDSFLAAVLAGKSPRLMIAMPPRHGKSELASRRFPAFAFGRNPDLSIIGTAYGADLASRVNRDVQRVMDSQEYAALFPQTRLKGSAQDQSLLQSHGGMMSRLCTKNLIKRTPSSSGLRRADFFEIVGRRGAYRSAGVGGGITGMGGDILIVDDPFKDRASADSAATRERVWAWYTSTLYTRLAPGGGILIINTRWHADDLSGRLLDAAAAKRGDQWRVLEFPAIALEADDHRKRGDALHPERYPVQQLHAIRAALGTRDWEALYQQRPTPDGGAMFREEWLRFWLPKDLPAFPASFDQLLLSWDMTFKSGDNNDFVVGQVWGRKGADRYLLDQVRGRMGFTETLAAFRALAAKWPAATRKLVEDKANGPAVIDSLKHSVPGIVPVEPDGSKTARAHAITALFEAGNVYIPHPDLYPWIKEYIAELTRFPACAHDDQVDATTQALRDMESRRGMKINPDILRSAPAAPNVRPKMASSLKKVM